MKCTYEGCGAEACYHDKVLRRLHLCSEHVQLYYEHRDAWLSTGKQPALKQWLETFHKSQRDMRD